MSDPVAAGDIGGHEREGAQAKGQEKDVEHGSPLLAKGQQSGDESDSACKDAMRILRRVCKIRIKAVRVHE